MIHRLNEKINQLKINNKNLWKQVSLKNDIIVNCQNQNLELENELKNLKSKFEFQNFEFSNDLQISKISKIENNSFSVNLIENNNKILPDLTQSIQNKLNYANLAIKEIKQKFIMMVDFIFDNFHEKLPLKITDCIQDVYQFNAINI